MLSWSEWLKFTDSGRITTQSFIKHRNLTITVINKSITPTYTSYLLSNEVFDEDIATARKIIYLK